MLPNTTLLYELEKSAEAGDRVARAVLEHPTTQILLKQLVETPIISHMHFDVPANTLNLKDDERWLIAGYANVAVLDKQDEVITVDALKKAWERMRKAGPLYANVNLEHSNITVGKILLDEHVVDSEGVEHWSHVDDKGLYVLCELRKDIAPARKVWELANRGEFNAFSIGGRILPGGKRMKMSNSIVNNMPYWEITDLELYEVTVCRRGRNALSGYKVLKSYFDDGIISEDEFIAKSDELKKVDRIVQDLVLLSSLTDKHLPIVKSFVSVGWSAKEDGEQTAVVLVKMNPDTPERRFVEKAILKALPEPLWSNVEFRFSEAEPEGAESLVFKPIFDLQLVPSGVEKAASSVSVDVDAIRGDDKRALRAGIISEYDAVNLYEQLASVVSSPEVKKLFLDIAKEEKVHVGEFQAQLVKIDPETEQSLLEGAKESEQVTKADGDAVMKIEVKPEGHKSKPKEYAHIPDSQFADPVNYKYPIDKEHVKAAWSYLHVEDNRKAGGYTKEEWRQMQAKARAAMEKYGFEVHEKSDDSVSESKVDSTFKNIDGETTSSLTKQEGKPMSETQQTVEKPEGAPQVSPEEFLALKKLVEELSAKIKAEEKKPESAVKEEEKEEGKEDASAPEKSTQEVDAENKCSKALLSPEVIKALEGKEVPEPLKKMIEESKAALKADPIAELTAQVQLLAKSVAELQSKVVAKSDFAINIDEVAKKVSENLKAASPIIQKSEHPSANNAPEVATDTPVIKSLRDVYNMSWQELDAFDARRRANVLT